MSQSPASILIAIRQHSGLIPVHSADSGDIVAHWSPLEALRRIQVSPFFVRVRAGKVRFIKTLVVEQPSPKWIGGNLTEYGPCCWPTCNDGTSY